MLGSVKPQLMLAAVAALLGSGRWAVVGWAAGLFAVWAAAATAVLGPGCWADWLGAVRASAGAVNRLNIYPHAMYNLKGLVFGLFGEEQAPALLAFGGVALLAGFAAVVRLFRLPDHRPRLRLAFGFALLLLLNPHVYPYDAVTWVLPMVLFATDQRPAGRAGATLPMAVVAATPWVVVIDAPVPGPDWPLGLRPFRLLMIGTIGWMAWELFRSPAAVAPAEQPADRGAADDRP